MRWIRWFSEVGLEDVALVGGKNASLGEMIRALTPLGIRVPNGFAITTDAYRHLLEQAELGPRLAELTAGIRRDDIDDLLARSERIRALLVGAPLPAEVESEIRAAYRELSSQFSAQETDVAVRSSATAEDLPEASFAGQQDTYLNIQGEAALLDAVKRCFASLFTARAMGYRADMSVPSEEIALSVGVQKMVRSDLASSGVMFSLDPESGHRGVVLITTSYGLGEAIVQGRVAPDQFYVHKAKLEAGHRSLVWKRLGAKEGRMVHGAGPGELRFDPVPESERLRYSLSEEEVLALARWGIAIEQHYGRRRGAETPVDVEWGKDGLTGELFILQARPETVHSRKTAKLRIYRLVGQGTALTEGLAVGSAVAVGQSQVIRDPGEISSFKRGQILVTESTDPDWEPIMKMAAGIVTERGGRTSHAAIVARELGIPAVLGTGNATSAIPAGETVTLSCAGGDRGVIYQGALEYEVDEIDREAVARPRTQMMLNVGNPEQAFHSAQIPNDGVGLARMEFIFSSWVRVHPLALTRYARLPWWTQQEVDRATQGYSDKLEYFVDKVSQGVGTIAAAFWPKPVILRLSDFKSNEYASLVGGAGFEPDEENPMLGWRGASRYYHPDYKEGFLLELKAIRRVRERFGFENLKLMVPFCRTPEEGRRVLQVMREAGLKPGRDGLEVYVMAELPSNVFQADAFAAIFDGFSIGSNDLTQLILGVDRDSSLVAPIFDERNEAVRAACAHVIAAAHRHGRKVGICGQAPSDYPEFAAFLVERGIDSLSLSPDAVIRTAERVLEAEKMLPAKTPPASAEAPAALAETPPALAEAPAALAETPPALAGGTYRPQRGRSAVANAVPESEGHRTVTSKDTVVGTKAPAFTTWTKRR
jgi:pyruvate,water dikinase